MIKLKPIVLSEGRSKKITIDEAIQIIKKNNPSGISKNYIYRGIGNTNFSAGFVQPSKYNRKSAYTINTYTTLFDNLPSWQKYPKRSKSIVCTTRLHYSSNFGNSYVIFPKEGSKIGICPDADIWTSFFDLHDNGVTMDDFNYEMKKLFNAAGNHSDEISYPKMLKMFDFISRHKAEYNREIGNEILDIWDSNEEFSKLHFFNFLNKFLLNPKYNNFRLTLYNSKFNYDTEIPHELWTDGDCVIIESDHMHVFLKKLRAYK